MSAFSQPGKHSVRWKAWRAVGRGKSEGFFLEHAEAVLELLDSSNPPREVLLSFEKYQGDREHWEQTARRFPEVDWFLVPGERLNQVVTVRGSSGLCGLFLPRRWKLDEIASLPFLLVCWEVQDPGNLGTLVRSCSALAGGAVVLVGGCKLWTSKVARASAGALFRTPSLQMKVEEGLGYLDSLKGEGRHIFSAVPRHGKVPSRLSEEELPVAVLIGNESHGLPEQAQSRSTLLTVPMSSGEESLNAGVAGSLLCYEWARGRG